MTNEPAGGSAPGPDNTATTKIPLPPAGDREPEVPVDGSQPDLAAHDFQPDVPDHEDAAEFADTRGSRWRSPRHGPDAAVRQAVLDARLRQAVPMPASGKQSSMPASGRPPADYGGDPTRESLPFDVPREPPIEAATSDEDVHLIPGAVIGGGRYRLLVFHGGPPNLQFWQALDTALDRQVALTFVDPDATLSDDELQEILSRTLRLSRIDMPGVARVLDVANTGSGGLVVAEWIRGGSLAEVAETAPSPIGGARAIQSLAAAAELGAPLGCRAVDRPPQPRPGQHRRRRRVGVPRDHAGGHTGGRHPRYRRGAVRAAGQPVAAGRVRGAQRVGSRRARRRRPTRRTPRCRPSHPVPDLGRCGPRGPGGWRHPQCADAAESAAAGHRDRRPHRAHLSRRRTRVAAGAAGPRAAPDDPETQARRRKALMIGLGVGGAVIIVALIVLATVLSRIFGDVGDGLGGDELGLNAPTASESGGGGGGGGGDTVKPVSATVFSPEGEADAPTEARLAIDGNPATVWPIDTYTDPVPFPNFKNGVGLMLQLPKPTKIGEVTIDVNSTGTAVEIRSAQTSTPSSLADTTVLTPATTLKPGQNTIKVDNAAPTSNLLVWVSTLGTVDGASRSDIAEITLKAAS